MSLRDAAKMALEALQYPLETSSQAFDADKAELLSHRAIDALRAALAEPEQEPVAWELRMGKTDRVLMEITNNPERAQNWRASLCEVVPLYYAPTPRKPLTDEEIDDLMPYCHSEFDISDYRNFARAIEKAHGIGEQR